MNKDPNKSLLSVLDKVKMATVYHFQPWLSAHTDSFKGSLSWSTRLIVRLRDAGLIKPVNIFPLIRRPYRYNAFYSTKAGVSLAYREIEHQSGLIDVLMAFIYSYPEHDIEIKYTPTLKADGKAYRPDALVKLTSADLRRYDFIIEFERSRNPQAILKEKLRKNQRMPSFKELGLSDHTKILYVYSHENFNVFNRPNQYKSCPKEIQSLETGFSNLLKSVRELPDHKYRFLPYHQFTRLAEPIWTTPKGNKVSLI